MHWVCLLAEEGCVRFVLTPQGERDVLMGSSLHRLPHNKMRVMEEKVEQHVADCRGF